jgi:hypothetical protein
MPQVSKERQKTRKEVARGSYSIPESLVDPSEP